MLYLLQQKNILVTREQKQAKEFSQKIVRHDGKPFEVPLLKISCQDLVGTKNVFNDIDSFTWIFFTSANGVDCFFRLAEKYRMATTFMKGKKIATVGHKTEERLKEHGYVAHFIPTVYTAEYMAEQFLNRFSDVGKILLVRGNRSLNMLPKTFSELDINYKVMEVYETTIHYEMKEQLCQSLQQNVFDFITFTSPSTIDAFISMDGMKYISSKQPICVCIGTTTEKRAVEAGFQKIIIPQQFTIDGMIKCMSDYLVERNER